MSNTGKHDNETDEKDLLKYYKYIVNSITSNGQRQTHKEKTKEKNARKLFGFIFNC